jgi:D-threo-aldose 1-dehydrogenase
MEAVCREHDTDLATAALQASVNDSRTSTTVIGFSKPSWLHRILTGLSAELAPELFERLEELLPARETGWTSTSPLEAQGDRRRLHEQLSG